MDYNSKNFCILPWSHLYFFTDGHAYPCPKLAGDPKFILGKNTDSVESLWNSDVLKTMRMRMLQNKEITECDMHCNKNISSCKAHVGLDLLEYVKSNIIGTLADGTSRTVTLLGANIIESNLCNYKCVYCHKNYSSKHFDGTIMKSIGENTELYTKYFDGLKEIWLAGGEPVLHDMSYKILERLIAENKLDTRIRVITNLSCIGLKNKDFYKLLSNFKNAIVYGSWDMDGAIGEYIREGSNSDTIYKTIHHINSQHIKFYLQPVISIFNIFYLFDFHKRLYEKGLIKRDNVRYYPLTDPDYYRISILPDNMKLSITELLYNYIEWLEEEQEPDLYANHERPGSYVNKIIKLMNTGIGGHYNFSPEENRKRLKMFFNITQEKDLEKYGYHKFLSLYKDHSPQNWL
jgi:sulfatase maturation enzyme AslB (radical SAM superfamily)